MIGINTKLIFLLLLVAILTACAPSAPHADSEAANSGISEMGEPTPESAASETFSEPQTPPEELFFTHLPPVPFMEESVFDLQGIAADYVRDYDTFYDRYQRDELFAQGVIDAASYVVGETRAENLVGDSVLIFTEKYTLPVAGSIGIGDNLEAVVKAFGEPAAFDEAYRLTLYKTATFYLAFAGDPIETIYVSRRIPTPETETLLQEFFSSEPLGFPYQSWGMYGTQLWRGSMVYYSPGGLCIWDAYDDDFNPYYPITIYSDYEGLVPENLGEEEGVFFREVDYPEHKIMRAIAENEVIDHIIASASEPAWDDLFSARFFSPDRSIAVLEYSLCTYERSGYLLRYLDGSLADRFLQFGHFPSEQGWIGNRYLLVNSMFGFGIYDVRAADGQSSCPFYVRSESYSEPWIRESSEDEIVILGENFTIIQPGQDDVEIFLESNQALHVYPTWSGNQINVRYEVKEAS